MTLTWRIGENLPIERRFRSLDGFEFLFSVVFDYFKILDVSIVRTAQYEISGTTSYLDI